MRLKRLELYGFKSFASRTAFDFGEGIAAIIGPNGSGKSNVADGIRWVMGEQSYNTLRAKTTEDMIFAGGGGRPRMGLAEVLITLDNSDGTLPLDYSEVVLGRRAYRSGENEYLLNGNQVRYRDVLDVLGGAGLARSKYTVIGQGLVDAALSLRPEARRALFEEAAGVSLQLRKREEALRRIEETERNLDRVRDILHELVPRGRTLRRQAERAEEHGLLRRDLEELQRIWYGYQWQRRQRALSRAEEEAAAQATLLQGHRARAEELAAVVSRLDDEVLAIQRTIVDLSQQLDGLRAEGDACEREMAITQERMNLVAGQRASLEAEVNALGTRRDVLSQEAARSREELAQQEQALSLAKEALSAVREASAAAAMQRRQLAEQVAAVEARLGRLERTLSALRARAEQMNERRGRLAAEKEEVAQAKSRLDERRARLSERSEALTARVQETLQRRERAEAEVARLNQESAAAREQLEGAEREQARLERQRDSLAARLESLTRLRQEMAGYHPGVRAVVAPGTGLRGILGTVASLMTVPPEIIDAIESALGARLQNVVTETWADAAAAIDYLKGRAGGWATFLPVDTVRGRPAVHVSRGRGVVGVASELVQFEERLRPVFEMLLGGVVVVDDLDTARRLLDARTAASLFVTLEGETVQPSGALSGGSRARSSTLLAQEGEWHALPQRIASVDRDLGTARDQSAAQRAACEELRAATRALEGEYARLRKDAEDAERAAAAHASALREASRERDWRAERLTRVDTELAELAQRQSVLQDEQRQTEAEQVSVLAASRDLRARLQSADQQEARQRLAECETRVAVAERTVESQRVLLESHLRNRTLLDEQMATKAGQIAALQQEIAANGTRLEQARDRLDSLSRHRNALTARLEPARAALAAAQSRRREAADAHSQALERLRETELAQGRAALERDRAQEDLLSLAADIESNLGPVELPGETTHQLRLSLGDEVIELPQVDSVPSGLAEQIRQLRVRLRRIGNVNPDAPQEYEQLLDRQTFLESQQADLRGAIASLHEVIAELDGVIERDFRDTVRAVDSAFGEYFQRLFEGGSAQLVLTDPDDVSTSGVDILARPPGKRLQNLSLLSGGERALTAVALLFALLKANPVPFCCLDEVDAALDEANVQRFRDLLVEHAESTQFVVITHNRRTIEAASTIYGISMGERGVSETISLRLPEDGKGNGDSGTLAALDVPEGQSATATSPY